MHCMQLRRAGPSPGYGSPDLDSAARASCPCAGEAVKSAPDSATPKARLCTATSGATTAASSAHC
eukprot:1844541-Pyramimonas_sp.AAC.1